MDVIDINRITEELKRIRILKELELKYKYSISKDEIKEAYNKKPSWV